MIATLYSGGKDSTLAIHKMHDAGKETALLISMVSDNDFSYMFHKPNIKFTSLQAEAMGIRQVFFTTKGEKESELADLEKALVDSKVTELITGAVASVYQRDRINIICKKLNIAHHAPLWGMDPFAELEIIARDLEAIVTSVSAEGMDESFLGSRVDAQMITKLRTLNQEFHINPSFEGGEAESFVLNAPLFKKRIVIDKAHNEWHGSGGIYVIDAAHLE